jgi:hypothetical protein
MLKSNRNIFLMNASVSTALLRFDLCKALGEAVEKRKTDDVKPFSNSHVVPFTLPLFINDRLKPAI